VAIVPRPMRRSLAALALAFTLALAASATAATTTRVGVMVIRIVDHRRSIRLPNGTRVLRTLVTYVRYPAIGPSSSADAADAQPARAAAPYPLVVFAHGFDTSPAPYARLLHYWAAHGYVVAAPVFPLTNPRAPGGPDERDIVNEPRDMSVVISRLISSRGTLAGLVSPARIAVAGHSDGAVAALATAYDRRLRDRRVRAAVIMAGAAIAPFSTFAQGSAPALLAAQGTGDSTNAPRNTYRIFGDAPRPKYLLKLIGAGHLPPFTSAQPWLGIVERVTVAFLDRYLKGRPGALQRLRRAGNVRRRGSLSAEP
jgi:predicted dienelactone hydrolase